MFLKFVSLFLIFLSVFGCGSSSSDSASTPPVVAPPANEVPEPAPEIVEVICDGLARLPISSVAASHQLNGFEATNAIDNSFVTSSRWSSSNASATLSVTLAEAALVKGISVTWFNEDSRTYSYDVQLSQDDENFTSAATGLLSDAGSTRAIYSELTENTARQVRIVPTGNDINSESHIVEVEVFGCITDVASTIELDDWYLSIPVDEQYNSKSESISETTLSQGYFNAQFFFLNPEGGLVFRAPVEGARTSTNTKYTRTELREMLRRGNTSIKTQGVNKNNWVFSTAPDADLNSAGGVDGELMAELTVDHVTTTGESYQIGRVVIGQIHANDDEPIRVYYRKLPNNEKGAIYFAHEIEGGDDEYHEIIGSRDNDAENPDDGILLGEKFGYKIVMEGDDLTFTVMREGMIDISKTIDISASGYQLGGQYMYFKAGVYNLNNSGDPKEYTQATFYQITNLHTGYSGT